MNYFEAAFLYHNCLKDCMRVDGRYTNVPTLSLPQSESVGW